MWTSLPVYSGEIRTDASEDFPEPVQSPLPLCFFLKKVNLLCIPFASYSTGTFALFPLTPSYPPPYPACLSFCPRSNLLTFYLSHGDLPSSCPPVGSIGLVSL